MAAARRRILLIDDHPSRLLSAATGLIVSGYLVLALSRADFHVLLARRVCDLHADLMLIRTALDRATERLCDERLAEVPLRRLPAATVFHLNLTSTVEGYLADIELRQHAR